MADKLNSWKTDPIKVKSEIFKRKKSDESQIFYVTEVWPSLHKFGQISHDMI